MSDTDSENGQGVKKRPMRAMVPLLFGLIGGVGIGFAAVFFDPLELLADPPESPVETDVESTEADTSAPMTTAAFLPIPPVVVSLGPDAPKPHLRFAATLDIHPDRLAEAEYLLPRISDVLITYLRAVRPTDLEDPSAMFRLRAQMMRRVELILGPESVRDLLITEFILA
ncbi:flagellar basal body-associated FliL family protein [Pontivivens insulae]|uniref:Flagellar protein FliL n=1 Tax=Pontivivens insulae TaxID=1639689 RepID=A0A2R8A9Y3_9RHOB|nr:flagellar basal body-associated FliL family protein [Pontivivens insulae]RED12944.1 flagellar FliL protein [Pontivivens insulae]SPF29037.1 Flagellar FliL protein [Pontivivens insulae]